MYFQNQIKRTKNNVAKLSACMILVHMCFLKTNNHMNNNDKNIIKKDKKKQKKNSKYKC